MNRTMELAARQLGCALFLCTLPATSTAGQVSTPRQAQEGTASEGQSPEQYGHESQRTMLREHLTTVPSGNKDYQIGAEDLLAVSVYGAPDLSNEVRVAADGSISMPLIGTLQAADLTPVELESVLEGLLRRTYMKNPHVGVRVKEMESHSVSVFGAVRKPGVFQIRTARPLIEILSMAEGLAEDAGDRVIIMRSARTVYSAETRVPLPAIAGGREPLEETDGSAKQSIEIGLKGLLDTDDPRYNVLVYAGDVVKVARAGIVYVVGEVHKPGGYLLKTNENISLLQAIALAEGVTLTAAGNRTRIIRTDGTGARTELPINLKKVLAGRVPDPLLQAKDIIFIPNNSGKAALYRSTQGIVATASAAAIYRW